MSRFWRRVLTSLLTDQVKQLLSRGFKELSTQFVELSLRQKCPHAFVHLNVYLSAR